MYRIFLTRIIMNRKSNKTADMKSKIVTIVLFIIATAFSAKAQIVFSELNYHSDSTVNAGDWIELWNTGNAQVDLSNWKLDDGNILNPPYTIPNGTKLNPDQRIVLASNLTRFDALHPGVFRIGPMGFEFSNNSEQITLLNELDAVVSQFTYLDTLPWNKCADGHGRTLELLDPAVSPGNPANWRCGCIKGSPGAAFSPCTSETLLVSEINYRSDSLANAGDWVELWNRTNGSLNLSGYRLRDGNGFNVYVFPSGTIMNPQSRLVVYADLALFNSRHPNVNNKVGPLPFAFDGNGEYVKIYNSLDVLIQSVSYDDDGTWPKCADGEGYTLELDTLFTNADDVNVSESWFCGCPEGSPGTAFINTCGLSISENELIGNLQIWPNPADLFLNLETASNSGRIEIIALDGKVMQTRTVQGEQITISLENIPAGMYLIRFVSAAGVLQSKFIKN